MELGFLGLQYIWVCDLLAPYYWPGFFILSWGKITHITIAMHHYHHTFNLRLPWLNRNKCYVKYLKITHICKVTQLCTLAYIFDYDLVGLSPTSFLILRGLRQRIDHQFLWHLIVVF